MVSTQLKNISQIGSFPQVGVKIKIVRNHHPDNFPTFEKQHIPTSGCPPPFSNSWGTIATARSKHWELLLRCMAPWKKRRNGSALLGGDRYHPLQEHRIRQVDSRMNSDEDSSKLHWRKGVTLLILECHCTVDFYFLVDLNETTLFSAKSL